MRSPSSLLDSVESDPISEVVSALEEDIIFGRIHPRERLTEDSLMARFKVKRHVVREALSVLSRSGIVEKERNKGATVREFSPDEIEHIYEMREHLHRWAAERIPLPADAALIRRLRTIQDEHGAAVDAGDLRRVYRLNNEFHEALFSGCGNPYLVDEIAHFAWLSHAIRSYRIADPRLLEQARLEHVQMIDALAAGDRRELVRLCVDHIQPSKQAYLASIRLLVSAAGAG